MSFYKLTDGIYKCDIPYEDGFTCSFIFENGNRQILADFGATKNDVTDIIVPAVKEANFNPSLLICSHCHSDHCGGLEYTSEFFPHSEAAAFSADYNLQKKTVRRLTDGEILLDRYKVLNLKGHTDDGMGILDIKSGILVSFDSLQQYGIGNYGLNVDNPTGYKETLEKVRNMHLNGIISSHGYFPMGISAFGEDVPEYLNASVEAFKLTEDFTLKNKNLTPREIEEEFTLNYPELPKIPAWTFMNILKFTH